MRWHETFHCFEHLNRRIAYQTPVLRGPNSQNRIKQLELDRHETSSMRPKCITADLCEPDLSKEPTTWYWHHRGWRRWRRRLEPESFSGWQPMLSSRCVCCSSQQVVLITLGRCEWWPVLLFNVRMDGLSNDRPSTTCMSSSVSRRHLYIQSLQPVGK